MNDQERYHECDGNEDVMKYLWNLILYNNCLLLLYSSMNRNVVERQMLVVEVLDVFDVSMVEWVEEWNRFDRMNFAVAAVVEEHCQH